MAEMIAGFELPRGAKITELESWPSFAEWWEQDRGFKPEPNDSLVRTIFEAYLAGAFWESQHTAPTSTPSDEERVKAIADKWIEKTSHSFSNQILAHDITSALADERERCAKIADNYATFGNGYKRIRKEIAAAIRGNLDGK